MVISVLKTIDIGAVFIQERFLSAIHEQKIGVWCAITAA
jgi:hypothetical protein